MNEQYGIEETKELLVFVVSLANALAATVDDGFDWQDAIKMVPVFTKLPKAIEGAEKIPQELIDLDEQELQELTETIGKLDFLQQDQMNILNQALMTSADLVKLVALVQKARKKAS